MAHLNIPRTGELLTLDKDLTVKIWPSRQLIKKFNLQYGYTDFTINAGEEIAIYDIEVRRTPSVTFRYLGAKFLMSLEDANTIVSYSNKVHPEEIKTVIKVNYPGYKWAHNNTNTTNDDFTYEIAGVKYVEPGIISYKKRSGGSGYYAQNFLYPHNIYGEEITKAKADSMICSLKGLRKKDCIFKRL